MQEGLKVLGNALDLIRNSIKYIRGSETRMVKFKQCIDKFDDIEYSCGFSLDVPTRWNSRYLMLKGALKYWCFIGSLPLVDECYKYCPSKEEKICRFLLPFYDMTTLIFATSYPTSNLYFLQVCKVQSLLLKNVKDGDEVIKHMAELVMIKFHMYWDEYSVVLAFGAILDPRMNLQTLAYCFEKIDPVTFGSKLVRIKEKLYNFFAKYSKSLPITTSSNLLKRKQGQSSSSSSASLPHLSLFDVSLWFHFISIYFLCNSSLGFSYLIFSML